MTQIGHACLTVLADMIKVLHCGIAAAVHALRSLRTACMHACTHPQVSLTVCRVHMLACITMQHVHLLDYNKLYGECCSADVLVEIIANRRTIPRRKTTVNVSSQCDLLVLKLDDALQLCSMFPFLRIAMEAVAARREAAVAEASRGYARSSLALKAGGSLSTVCRVVALS